MSVAEVGSRIATITARLASLTPTTTAARTTSSTSLGGSVDALGDEFQRYLASAAAERNGSSSRSAVEAWSGNVGSRALAAGSKYLGVPYRWGGTDPDTGLDCSGLVQQAYEDIGITLPRVSRDQAKAGVPVASLADAKPGDLIAFGSPVDHIALYAGDGKILQAPRTGDVVKISEIRRPIVAIRRIEAPAVAATAAAPPGSVAALGSTSTEAARLDRFAAAFAGATAKYALPPGLLRAVAGVESSGRADAVSGAGARGLMQLMPSTARSLGVDPDDPTQAIDGAARYLRSNLDAFGSVDLALAAYNAGPGAVRRAGGIPPYAETRAYVQKVTARL